MQVTVRNISGLKFEAEARGHTIIGDQPESNGGEDAGMHPQEWLLAAFGHCVAFYVHSYCRARDLETNGIRVEASAHKSKEKPLHMEGFKIDIHIPNPLEKRHYKGLERAANSCIIHHTLEHANAIQTAIHCGDEMSEHA